MSDTDWGIKDNEASYGRNHQLLQLFLLASLDFVSEVVVSCVVCITVQQFIANILFGYLCLPCLDTSQCIVQHWLMLLACTQCHRKQSGGAWSEFIRKQIVDNATCPNESHLSLQDWLSTPINKLLSCCLCCHKITNWTIRNFLVFCFHGYSCSPDIAAQDGELNTDIDQLANKIAK